MGEAAREREREMAEEAGVGIGECDWDDGKFR